MYSHTIRQETADSIFAVNTKKPTNLNDNMTIEFEKYELMSSLAFSCSGPYDPPVYPDYADPDSFA